MDYAVKVFSRLMTPEFLDSREINLGFGGRLD